MGGMGFIENNKARCMLSVLINTHMLMAARKHGVDRFFYSSSACVYPAYKQTNADVIALKESDAYPADARMATAGRSCSASGCAAIFARISASRPASRVITMSTVPTEPGMAVAKRRRRQCRARSRWR